MTEVRIPQNWLFNSNTFARGFSDPRAEGVATYSVIGADTYSSKAGSKTPIKITCDSNSVSFVLQKLLLQMDISLCNADGSPAAPGAALKNTFLGLDAFIKTLTIKAGGQTVEQIDDWPSYCATTYKNLPLGQKKLLSQMTGYGNTSVFATSSSVTSNWHPLISFFHSSLGQYLSPWSLPNQAMEIIFTLNDPSQIFTASTVAEYRISNNTCFIPYITPPPEIVIQATRAIANGQSLYYDYMRTRQTDAPCSGARRNMFLFYMSGVRSLANTEFFFIDDNVTADPSKDKALSFSSQNLNQFWYQLGPGLTIPNGTQGFKHSATNSQALLLSALSNNNFEQLGDIDIDFSLFDSQQFSIPYSFQSTDEANNAALSFQGSDGLFRIITEHSSAPSPVVKMVLQYRENVTLSIGQTVAVI
ncbi:hypothetical protein PhCBS80983_g06163 [Powellomyces hirtus]|uniref:Uncharacterized protein n=1 Tax=Powellomyces hirtus TaxID=109895 RepID=A0A507DQ27_9FUNG|nr:hypothetical protein PhCBS80983_g06163 [Powellomyces hirtus]DAC81658.1 TPA_asm: hexon [Powellomyces chytrid fungus MELD virus 3]